MRFTRVSLKLSLSSAFPLAAPSAIECPELTLFQKRNTVRCPPGCTISGSGPTAVAIVDSVEAGERVKKAMMEAFVHEGKLEINSAVITQLGAGARQVPL